MSLPQKAINALIDIRKSLLASTEQEAVAESGGRAIGEKTVILPFDGRKSHIMRHARQRGMSYQRYKQRGG